MFTPVNLNSKDLFKKYLQPAEKDCCDYAFANLFAWSQYYHTAYAEYKGFLVIRFHIAGSEKLAYLEPLGSGNMAEVIHFIFEDAQNGTHQPVRFFSLSENFVRKIQNFPEAVHLFFYKDRNFGNYIYKREILSHLTGRKLHSKRNLIAQFDSYYPNACVREIDPKKDIVTLKNLLQQWISSQNMVTTTILREREMIENSLAHYKELDLYGILLFIERQSIAFAYGSQITPKTFCVHVEKADIRFKGAYAKINQQLAQSLGKETLFVNREEDMGHPALQKAKLSYYPDHITEEIFAFDSLSEEAAVWALWKQTFPEDDDAFLATFIYPYSNTSSRITLYKDGQLASMLHLFFFDSDWGKVGYIYGLATNEKFRGQGFAKQVIAQAIKRAEENGCIAIWTIQSNKEFKSWHSHFDFSETQFLPLTFQTEDGFDFGDKNPQNNFGIFRILQRTAYLKLYAKAHSEWMRTFSRLEKETKNLSSRELAKNYPISGGFVLKYPVVSGQH